jgi:hypothetical protein
MICAEDAMILDIEQAQTQQSDIYSDSHFCAYEAERTVPAGRKQKHEGL